MSPFCVICGCSAIKIAATIAKPTFAGYFQSAQADFAGVAATFPQGRRAESPELTGGEYFVTLANSQPSTAYRSTVSVQA